jgi:hypothetical protein
MGNMGQTSMTDKNQCCVNVFRGWHSYPCHVPATRFVKGKWYCHIHDPEQVEKRKAKSSAYWDKICKEEKPKWHAKELLVACIAALPFVTDDKIKKQVEDAIEAST